MLIHCNPIFNAVFEKKLLLVQIVSFTPAYYRWEVRIALALF